MTEPGTHRRMREDQCRFTPAIWPGASAREDTMLRRRQVLASAVCLAAPSVARSREIRVLRFVPRSAVALLDPVWTTETATRAFGLQMFESLYGVDEKLN